MKTKNLLIVVLVLCLSLGGSITAFAAEVPEPNIEYLNPSPRFIYVMTASVGLKVSSSGAGYTVTINGIDSVNHIVGTVTLYKGSTYVDSANINVYSNYVNKSGSLKTTGTGNYKLTFVGTVYTNNGSEPLSLEITDSY